MTFHEHAAAATSDPALRAQRAAEQHLMDVYEAESVIEAAEENGAPDYEVPLSPASAPWDGCDTCQVREVIHASWPILRDDLLETLRGGGFGDAAAFLVEEYGLTDSELPQA